MTHQSSSSRPSSSSGNATDLYVAPSAAECPSRPTADTTVPSHRDRGTSVGAFDARGRPHAASERPIAKGRLTNSDFRGRTNYLTGVIALHVAIVRGGLRKIRQLQFIVEERDAHGLGYGTRQLQVTDFPRRVSVNCSSALSMTLMVISPWYLCPRTHGPSLCSEALMPA
jgi:hypothetical protein